MKKTATPKPPIPPPLTSRQDVEDNVALIVALRISEQKLAAQINAKLHEVKTELMPKLKAIRDEIEAGTALTREWAEANPSEFGEARSIQMQHAVVGFRKGNPRLEKLSRRWSWERVLETIQSLELSKYLRATWEVNKEAILADRDTLGDEGLKSIGLKVDQADRFYIETDLEAPEARIQEAA